MGRVVLVQAAAPPDGTAAATSSSNLLLLLLQVLGLAGAARGSPPDFKALEGVKARGFGGFGSPAGDCRGYGKGLPEGQGKEVKGP